MHIVVCVKQVPDTTEVKINMETGTLIRTGVPSIINPYDHFALQTAISLKKQHAGEVTVISMGPPQARSVIQLGLALGADTGILLTDMAFAGSDTWATSYALSKAVKKTGRVDLVLCGMQAIDGDTAQTGPGIAHQLGIPQITFAENVEIEGKKIKARRLTDSGYELVETRAPALATMVLPKDYVCSYPSFMNIFESLKKTYHQWTAEDIGAAPAFIGLKGSPTQVNRIYPPPQREKAVMVSGSANELVEKLIDILKKEDFLKGVLNHD